MSKLKLLNAILRGDFLSFIHQCFNTLHPGTRFMNNWHIKAMAHWLMSVYSRGNSRLVITMPPRSLKSIVISVAFPAFLLGLDPTLRIVCVSYSRELAEHHAGQMRKIMESEWYKRIFPNTRLDRRKSPLHDLNTTAGGGRLSTSVGGTLTGRGGDIIIIDDPHKANEVESDAQRINVINWFRSTVYSRLNDKVKGSMVLVQQRLHAEDLAGYLLDQEDWHHLNFPAIAEEDEDIEVGEEQWHERLKGDLLHPEREPQEALDEALLRLGSYGFAAQYQQRPAPLGGGEVKWEWFKFYDHPPARLAKDMVVQSWDVAQSLSDSADYSVCTTWLVHDKRYYLVGLERVRLEFPSLVKAVKALAHQWAPNVILIEAVGCGLGLAQQIVRELPYPVRGIKPEGDKLSRLRTESPAIEAGYVWLPKEADWMPEFQREILHFPNAKHDDQVDSMTQFLYWMRRTGPNRPRLNVRCTVVGSARKDYTTEQILNMGWQ